MIEIPPVKYADLPQDEQKVITQVIRNFLKKTEYPVFILWGPEKSEEILIELFDSGLIQICFDPVSSSFAVSVYQFGDEAYKLIPVRQ